LSSPRGLANHSLYLARIQLAAWREQLGREVVPAATLDLAFAPAACEHLNRAYGWFLLTLMGRSDTSVTPPKSCSDLPDVDAGKVVSAEIREFAKLEQDGWLRDLLSVESSALPQQRTVPSQLGNLAVNKPDTLSIANVSEFADQLDAHMSRMSNSLDEY